MHLRLFQEALEMRMSGSTFVSLHECYRGPEPGFDRKIRFFNAYQLVWNKENWFQGVLFPLVLGTFSNNNLDF